MGAIVLDGAVVVSLRLRRRGCAGRARQVVGEGELVAGNPAKKVRMLSDAEIEALYYGAGHPMRLKDQYLGASPRGLGPPRVCA